MTAKAQVYKIVVNSHKKVIFKCFASKQNFLSECFALTIFENESFISQLLDSSEESLYLVIEYLPYKFFIHYTSYLEKISYNLGILHAYSSTYSKLLNQLFPDSTERHFLEKIDNLVWVKEKHYFEEALLLSTKYYGETRVPIMIGDIKPEHVRLRGKLDSVFIDMETFSVGF